MINFRMLRLTDYPLWICVGLLLLIGAVMILSSTFSMQARGGEDPFLYLKKHLISLFLALLVMAVLMYFDFNHLKTLSAPIYIFIVLILGIVLVKGFMALGAQRWIGIGPISFQPSEAAKLATIIVLAAYLESRVGMISGLMSLIPPALLVGVPFILIFKQPDLGTSLVLLAILLGMLMWAKAPEVFILLLFSPLISIFLYQHIVIWFIFIAILTVALFSTKVKWFDSLTIVALNLISPRVFYHVFNILKGYQKQRLLAFLNPNIDPRGAGYHSLQSKVAIGSGGFFGRGLFHGTQTQLQFIPQQFSDFIFSAVGEELGFLGALAVVALFTIIILRAVKIASESRTVFGSFLAGGIAVMFMFHMLVNIGMTLGLLPVVGIPLPFMSFGGTALLVDLAAVGILQNIAMRRSKLVF